MLGTILNAFRVADIRKKLAFTAVMLALYRLGAYIPVPGVNTDAIEQISKNYAGSNILGFLNLFTGTFLRVPRPAAFSASRSTAAPSSNLRSRSARLTGWVCVRNGSNGIDIFLFGPRSLRIRMWSGFWPPSKRARSLAPAREP